MNTQFHRMVVIQFVLLGLASQSASSEVTSSSMASLVEALSTMNVLDKWFEQSASTTYGAILTMRLVQDPADLARRKTIHEGTPDSPLEPADITLAIVIGGPRATPPSPEAKDFAKIVRRKLNIPDELDCSLLDKPQPGANQPLMGQDQLTFRLLMGSVSSATGVTRLLKRPEPVGIYMDYDTVINDLALGRDPEDVLPGGEWLSGVAADVAGYMLSCSGPMARETQLLFLNAVLEMAQEAEEAAIEAGRAHEAYLSQECSLYPVNKMAASESACSRPRICLALSGGGVRSAAFQVGIIQGLYDEKLLNQVDIISAVSGGAYATGWFINQRLQEPLSLEVPAYRFLQDADLRASDKSRSQLVTTTEGVTAAILGLLVAPLEWIRDRMARVEPERPTFFTEHHLYRQLLWNSFAPPTIGLDDLWIALHNTPDLPFPIFAATSHKGGCLDEEALPPMGDAADLERNVFEFSAQGVGSVGLGFKKDARSLFTVADAVTISGAAMDLVAGPGCSALRGAQIRLGARFNGDLLTDGGFSDNLAFFPLVRRGCEAIIVSDAEYDPEMVFGSYLRLKTALASHCSNLNIPDLEAQVARTARFCSQLLPEDRKQQCFVTAAYPRRDGSAGRAQEKSWFVGTLRFGAADPIPVVYFKLSLNEQSEQVRQRPAVRDALGWECPIKNCSFPQIPTTLQNLPPQIGAALRELGQLTLREAVGAGALSQQGSVGGTVQGEQGKVPP